MLTKRTTPNHTLTPSTGALPRQRPKAVLTCHIADLDRGVVLRVQGCAATDNLHEMQLALTALLARRVALAVLDFSDLTLLSSLAMGMLIGFRRDLARWQGRVKLACLPPHIHQALQTARLTDLLECHATVEEALATA